VNILSENKADDLAAIVAAAKKRIEMPPVITPQAIDLEKDSPDELSAKAKNVAVALATRFGSINSTRWNEGRGGEITDPLAICRFPRGNVMPIAKAIVSTELTITR
jgi:hypothetical protein